jgi:hypothetical protein
MPRSISKENKLATLPQRETHTTQLMSPTGDEESGRPFAARVPSSVSSKLAALDVNNDGHIDETELLEAVEMLVQEERSGRVLWRQAAALVAALLIVVGATVGCVYGIISLTTPFKASGVATRTGTRLHASS